MKNNKEVPYHKYLEARDTVDQLILWGIFVGAVAILSGLVYLMSLWIVTAIVLIFIASGLALGCVGVLGWFIITTVRDYRRGKKQYEPLQSGTSR